MRTSGALLAAVILLGPGCGRADERREDPSAAEPSPASPASPARPGTTVNEFFARGTPTFVLGTAGGELADRGIAAQVELVRTALFPDAALVLDSAGTWPPNPVVYGGPEVNSLVAGVELPFELAAGRLEIAGSRFDGAGYQLITVVPAGPNHPEFVLYAGTGTPGIAEINAVTHGPESILIIDAFGRAVTGSWQVSEAGVEAVLEAPARRIPWRAVERELGPVTARIQFPAQLETAADEAAVVDAVARGIAAAREALGVREALALSVFVHPDRRSKESLTGNAGDGHAVAMAMVVHVIRDDPAPGGALERLVAHETTHVLAHASWGPAGTPLLGEGLAVFVAGGYGGVALEQWRARLDAPPPLAELLTGFRELPEAQTYPLAGLLVGAAIELVGLAQVRAQLYGASASEWSAASERAGTSVAALEAALAAALGHAR